jgi:hypothetical protein
MRWIAPFNFWLGGKHPSAFTHRKGTEEVDGIVGVHQERSSRVNYFIKKILFKHAGLGLVLSTKKKNFVVYLFEKVSLKLTLNSQTSCLSLWSAGIAGVYHHTQSTNHIFVIFIQILILVHYYCTAKLSNNMIRFLFPCVFNFNFLLCIAPFFENKHAQKLPEINYHHFPSS